MSYAVRYSGTEEGLEVLLIAWGRNMPFKHAPSCDQDPRVLDCCFGDRSDGNPLYKYSLEADSCSTGGHDCLNVYFNDGETRTRMTEGDWLIFTNDAIRLYKRVKT